MSQQKFLSFLSIALSVTLLLPPGNSHASAPAEMTSSSGQPQELVAPANAGEPLPDDCDGVAPPGACCAFGYAYLQDAPTEGVTVTLQSLSGSVVITTTAGPASSDPYYRVDLSSAPLDVTPGEPITLTAAYRDMISARTWVVQPSGQQIDLGLTANPESLTLPSEAIDWIERAPMPTVSVAYAYATLDGKIYIIGGDVDGDSYGASTLLQRYDPTTNAWETDTNHGGMLAPLPAPRAVMVAGVINGKIHTVGGWDENYGYQDEHFVYDPAANTWSTADPLPDYPIGQFGVAWQNKLYVFGGWSGTYRNNVYEYAEPGGWTARADMPTARNHGTAAVYGNTIYAIAGNAGGTPSTVVEAYHPISDTWTTGLAALPAPKHWIGSSGAPVLAGGIYVIGPNVSDDVFAYDPPSDTWRVWNRLPKPAGNGLAEVHGALYVIGQETLQGIIAPWPGFGYNAGHTGRSPYLGPQDNTLAWTYPLSGTTYAPVTIGLDETLYIGTESGKLYAVAPDGDIRWVFRAGGGIRTAASIGHNGNLYFGSLDHNLYALSPMGSLLWTFPSGNEIYTSPTIAPDGSVYFASFDGNFYALHPDGAEKCHYTLGPASTAPAVGPDGTIYLGSLTSRRLYALNPDCSLKWQSDPAGNVISSSPTLSPDGQTVYYGADDGYLYARETVSGTLKWQSPLTYGGVQSPPAVGQDGTVYVGTQYGNLWALDPADGSLVWDYYTTLSVSAAPAVDAAGTVYFATHYGHVYAMNPDGSMQWSYTEGDGHFYASPAIGRDGKLYLGSTNGRLYAFGDPPANCGTRLTPWEATASLPQPIGTPFEGGGKQPITFNGYAYLFGGQTDGNNRLDTVYFSAIQPNGKLSPWAETTPLPGQYFDQAVVRIGKFVYLITGANGAIDVFYAPIQADGEIGAWVSTTPLDPSRQAFAATSYGEYLYVAGGNASGPTNKVWFNAAQPSGALGSWVETTPLPQPTQYHTIAAYDGYLYVLMPDQSVYYAPIQPGGNVGSWSATTSLPQPNPSHTTFILGDKIYLLGWNTAEAYEANIQPDGSLGVWQPSTDLPAARSHLYAGGQGCFAYALGGYDGSQHDATVLASRLAKPPVAAFGAAPLSGPAPLIIDFTDHSTGHITAWDWTFGDGQISGARHPEAVYTDPGDYSVTLTVSGPGGSDTTTRLRYIHVGEAAPPTPPIATIQDIQYTSWPGPAIQGEDVIYFYGDGVDTDEAGAYIKAYRWRSNLDGDLSTWESFSAPAADLSASDHTIYLSVKDDEGYWSPEVSRTLSVAAQPPGSVLTLILVNHQQFEALYGAAQADQVIASLNDLAAHPSVSGLVIQVENDPAVAAAYAAWNADPTSTDKANAVTEAIKTLADAQWASHPTLRYLVIVGDDRALPFRRVPDRTTLYPESTYTLVAITTTVGAALHDNMILTDDYYGDAVPSTPTVPGWDGHAVYIPDLGIGRLVETPEAIIAQIDAFLASGGVEASQAAVTGYSTVLDSATAICHELGNNGLATDCTLLGGSWGRSELIATLLDQRQDVASINGHATHFTFETPTDSVYATDIVDALADLTQALFYTPGCHAGLNVPPSDPGQPLDFPQVFAAQGANFVGNTGFGWLSRTDIGYSEQLMLDLTERLVFGQSAAVGRALAAAKQEYYLNEGAFDVYDEKILIESTLYGLPMTRYATAGKLFRLPSRMADRLEAEAGVLKAERLVARPDGLTINQISYQFPPVQPVTTDDGVYYTFGGQAQVGDAMPVQPKYLADLSFPQTTLHGVVLKSGVYTDIVAFDPVIDQVVTGTATTSEPAFTAAGWYPAIFFRFNELGYNQRLVTLLGQFDPNSETERLYSQLSFDIYYHDDSTDWVAPTITSVISQATGSAATVTVNASDAAGIEAVVVAYTDNQGTWASVELVESGGQWSGSLPVGGNTEFFVQVVDGAGNVAIRDAGGRYFRVEASPPKIYLPLVQR
jgi:outer membrane protein assembly factor BamB